MTFVRSLLFHLLFYLWSALFAFLLAPLLICPRRWRCWRPARPSAS